MAAELPRPGVEVIQEFRTVSPSVVTPTLVPCVVGACMQIVEVLNDQSLNADSKVTLAPFFTAKNASLSGVRYVYTGLNGKHLYLSVNNSPGVDVLFESDYMTPAAVVEAINLALNDAGVFGAIAETKPETIDGELVERTWTLRTVASGELQSVEVLATTDSEVWALLGLKPGWTFYGLDMYENLWMEIPPICFPDPRNNINELSVDPDSIRVFFATAPTNMRELQRKQAFCRRGDAVYAYDDGNGDALTPFVDVPGEDFNSIATGAYVTGTTPLAVLLLPGDLVGKTLTLQASDKAQTITFVNNATYPLTSISELLDQLNDFFEGLTFTNAAGFLRITASDLGQDSRVLVTGGTAVDELGLSASYVGSVDVSAAVRATGTLTVIATPIVATDTVTIDGKTYTFTSPVGALDGDVFLGLTDADALSNLLKAINLSGVAGVDYGAATTLHPTVEATASDATTLSARAKAYGVSGNLIAVSATGGTMGWGAPTLGGGAGTVVYPDSFHTPDKTLIIDDTTYTFSTGGAPATPAALLVDLNATYPDITFSFDGSNQLQMVKEVAGSLVIGAGTANAMLGLAAGTYSGPAQTDGVAFPVRAGDELFVNGKSYGYINQVATGGVATRLRMTKQVAMTMAATHTGSVDLTSLVYPAGLPGTTISLDGTVFAFAPGEPASESALLSQLAAAFTGFTFTAYAVGAIHYLRISKVSSGPMIVGAGSANAILGLTAGTYHPQLGDNFYIVARNLTGAVDRPTPELLINSGTPEVTPNIFRDTAGVPTTAKMSVYMMYKALRLDVTPATAKPGLLKFDTTTDLQNALSPITAANPLALGLYFALLNAPGAQVTGLGVDEITDDMPEGTVGAFTRAAEYLEGVEVYAIAPLTHDKSVAEIYNTHVTTMSAPENKGERIVLFNTNIPTHQLDTLVCSGTDGNSLGANTFDTGIANLSTLLLAAGVPNPIGTIDAKYGVYLDIASDGKKYSVQSVSGSIITIRLVFTSGENDDGFYAQSPALFPPGGIPLIAETFAIKVRGAELTLPTGKPDKAGIALTVQQYAQSFLNRRFWHIVPDTCAATLEGVEQQIEGYYMCAGYAGLIAGQPPQQSFTNFPLTGFTRVMGSNDTFSEKQLNVMAAGGNWIVVQDTLQSPLTARMALTTDMTSVETRTDSITKVVDFTAKIMRRGYRNFIGRFNVTQGFLDSLGHVGQGILTFLTESGVLIGGSLNNIVQDENAPDTVLIDATLDPPYPCNYIRLTLVI